MNPLGHGARLALGGVVIAACGSDVGDGLGVIEARQSAASYAITATVPEMLAAPGSYHLTIVEGAVSQVDEGVGMAWTLDENGEGEQRQILQFDDDAAMARSVHVTMAVDRVIAGAPPAGPSVGFGVAIDRVGDAAVLRDGFVGETFIAFLVDSAVFDYQPNLFGVLFDGGLLCRRGRSDPLECPALDDNLAAALDIQSVTAQDLGQGG